MAESGLRGPNRARKSEQMGFFEPAEARILGREKPGKIAKIPVFTFDLKLPRVVGGDSTDFVAK